VSLPPRSEYAGPRDQKLDLSVAGGLLDLLHRVQNGEASCLYAAKLIEIVHEEEMTKLAASVEPALTSSYEMLEGYEDGAPDASVTSKRANHVLVEIRAALARVRSRLT
jgi:hypothetical protein